MHNESKDESVENISKPAKKIRRRINHRKVTAKQAAFVTNLLEGATPTQSIIDAGYNCSTRQSAAVMASEALNIPNIRDLLFKRIDEGSYHDKFIKTWDKILDENTNDIWDIDQRMKTHSTKLAALQQIARIRGLEAPKRTEKATVDLTNLLPQRTRTK